MTVFTSISFSSTSSSSSLGMSEPDLVSYLPIISGWKQLFDSQVFSVPESEVSERIVPNCMSYPSSCSRKSRGMKCHLIIFYEDACTEMRWEIVPQPKVSGQYQD